MEPIVYKKVNEEIIKQYDYLKSLDLSLGWRIHRFWVWFYFSITAAFILLYVATSPNTFVVLKVMSLVFLAFMFFWALVVLAIDFIRKRRHLKKINSLLESAFRNETGYSIQFDEKYIVFITDKIRTEAEWTNWSGYREVDGTLFLFLEGYLYHSTSFSSAEIGKENLESLKFFVKKALPELSEEYLKRWYVL